MTGQLSINENVHQSIEIASNVEGKYWLRVYGSGVQE